MYIGLELGAETAGAAPLLVEALLELPQPRTIIR